MSMSILMKLPAGRPGFPALTLKTLSMSLPCLQQERAKSKVERSDFESAKDKVLMGVERKSMIISEVEKKEYGLS